MDPEEVTVGDGVPHINHRRGDTRRRAQSRGPWRTLPYWKQLANQHLRAAVHRTLTKIRVSGYNVETSEDTVFPLADEADNYWNYD